MGHNHDLSDIIMKAQNEANKSVQDLCSLRNADKFPEMMPSDYQKQITYTVELVSTAINEYHHLLQAMLKEQGLNLPNICDD